MTGVRARVSESGRTYRQSSARQLASGAVAMSWSNPKDVKSVANAQALTHRLLRGKPDATVDAFLAERRREAEGE
jgi:hypothetical protein